MARGRSTTTGYSTRNRVTPRRSRARRHCNSIEPLRITLRSTPHECTSVHDPLSRLRETFIKSIDSLMFARSERLDAFVNHVKIETIRIFLSLSLRDRRLQCKTFSPEYNWRPATMGEKYETPFTPQVPPPNAHSCTTTDMSLYPAATKARFLLWFAERWRFDGNYNWMNSNDISLGHGYTFVFETLADLLKIFRLVVSSTIRPCRSRMTELTTNRGAPSSITCYTGADRGGKLRAHLQTRHHPCRHPFLDSGWIGGA